VEAKFHFLLGIMKNISVLLCMTIHARTFQKDNRQTNISPLFTVITSPRQNLLCSSNVRACSVFLSLSLSLCLTHTLSLSCLLSRPLALSLALALSLSRALALSRTLSRALSLALSLYRSPSLSLSCFLLALALALFVSRSLSGARARALSVSLFSLSLYLGWNTFCKGPRASGYWSRERERERERERGKRGTKRKSELKRDKGKKESITFICAHGHLDFGAEFSCFSWEKKTPSATSKFTMSNY